MFKIDQVKNLFDCEQCKRAFDEMLESNPKDLIPNTFPCKLCDDEHYIPKKGFAINKSIQNALDIKLNKLKLNPVYEECKTEINDAKNIIQKIENLDRDPENYIFDENIQSIESTKKNCIKMSKKSKRLSTEIEQSKEELTDLKDDFDRFEIGTEKFEEIRQCLTDLNGGLNRKLDKYKDTKIGGKEYTFEFEGTDIKGLLGYFTEIEKVI
jgi:hypothetical protein